MESPLNAIVDELKRISSEEKASILSRFFKTGTGQYGEGDIFLGIKVPQTREIAHNYCQKVDLDDINILIQSQYHEVRLASLFILLEKYNLHKKASKRDGSEIYQMQRCVECYLANTTYINNWDLVDLTCYNLLGDCILTNIIAGRYDLFPNENTLFELSKSGYLWEERISIVSCIVLVRNGLFDQCTTISKTLLYHKHDLIHKAVGWVLREMGKKDKTKLDLFLSENYNNMNRTTLRYAIERYPKEERSVWMNK